MLSSRRGGRHEPRVLYWFRTPPHVKIGRSALDEEAIRLLEAQHPDITFDWPRILKAQPVIVEEPRPHKPEPPEEVKRKGREPGRGAQGQTRPTAPRASRALEPASERSFEPSFDRPPEPSLEPPLEPSSDEPSFEPSLPAVQLQELKEPTMIEAAVQADERNRWDAPVEAEPLGRASEPEGEFLSPRPIEALVGREGLERLRARHAALLAAISERIQDAAKRDFLRAEAERLDPDGWVTIDAARAALETYESDYETLRRQLPARRRRRRRRGRRGLDSTAGHAHAGDQHGTSVEGAETAEPSSGSDEESEP